MSKLFVLRALVAAMVLVDAGPIKAAENISRAAAGCRHNPALPWPRNPPVFDFLIDDVCWLATQESLYIGDGCLQQPGSRRPRRPCDVWRDKTVLRGKQRI